MAPPDDSFDDPDVSRQKTLTAGQIDLRLDLELGPTLGGLIVWALRLEVTLELRAPAIDLMRVGRPATCSEFHAPRSSTGNYLTNEFP